MEKRAFQLFVVVLLLLTLQLFDYSLNQQQPGTIPVTGAAVSGSQTATCAEASPCKSPTSWKCQSNSRCYDYSDCLFQCPSTPSSEKKDEQPAPTCTCGDWQTIGGCGEQGCPSGKVPQSKRCTGGSACKTENRCLESASCITTQPKCTGLICLDDEFEGASCSYKCSLDGKRYEQSECEQKCVAPDEKPPEKAFEGVNLVPELVISPSEGLKSGDTIEVTFYIKNIGSQAATQYGMKEIGATLSNLIYFYKGREYGPEAISPIYAPVNVLLLPDSAIKPGDAEKVRLAKQTVKIPDDFSGDLVIAAVVDAQLSYPETNENDNRPTRTLNVRAPAKPNLAIIGFETSIVSFASLPVTISPVFITVENKGELPASSTQFMENRITIFRGDTEVCRATAKESMAEGIEPRKTRKFALNPKFITAGMAGNQCSVDDAEANYRAVVEIDTPQLGFQGNLLKEGVIAESNEEDNKQTFPITARERCSPLGGEGAGQYCDILTGMWQNQKESGKQCSHNFECRTDLCIKNKCISEEKKTKILEIVG